MTSALPCKNKKPSSPYKKFRNAIKSLGRVFSSSGAATGERAGERSLHRRREEPPHAPFARRASWSARRARTRLAIDGVLCPTWRPACEARRSACGARRRPLCGGGARRPLRQRPLRLGRRQVRARTRGIGAGGWRTARGREEREEELRNEREGEAGRGSGGWGPTHLRGECGLAEVRSSI
jgi:hypothetical protein